MDAIMRLCDGHANHEGARAPPRPRPGAASPAPPRFAAPPPPPPPSSRPPPRTCGSHRDSTN
eukprot:9498074-Pyramimonas_sp.AAC.1